MRQEQKEAAVISGQTVNGFTDLFASCGLNNVVPFVAAAKATEAGDAAASDVRNAVDLTGYVLSAQNVHRSASVAAAAAAAGGTP